MSGAKGTGQQLPGTPEGSHRLGIVVVNYGSSELLRKNITAVAEASPTATVVIVDNFTTPEERRRAGALCLEYGWVLVEPDGNLGFGAGCNLGASAAHQAGADLLLFINPDATIDRPSIGSLRQVCVQDPLAMVGPVVVRPDGSVWSDGNILDLRSGTMLDRAHRAQAPDVDRYVRWLTGACLMMTSRLWNLVGGFAEEYFLYWEDVELCWRVREVGGSVQLVAGAVAVHDVGGTQAPEGAAVDARPKSAVYVYYNVRNRALFASRLLDQRAARRWLVSSPRFAWEVATRSGKRHLLGHPNLALAATRGARDGARIHLATRGKAPLVEEAAVHRRGA